MNTELAASPPAAGSADDGPIHVLHVGPHPADVERARHHLLGHGARFAVEGAVSGAECLTRLSGGAFDVLLLAGRAADVPPLELLGMVRTRRPRLPVVLLLASRDERLAAEAIRLGVFDYLVEQAGDLARLPLALERAAAHRRVTVERAAFARQAEVLARLRAHGEADGLLDRVADAVRDLLEVDWSLILLLEGANALVPRGWSGDAPRAVADMRLPAGASPWVGLWSAPAPLRLTPMAVTEPWSVAAVLRGLDAALGVPLVAHGRAVGALLVAAPPARQFGGRGETILRAFADLAALAVENRSLTVELVHAQRLATVGRMVAGVAHELNNPLAVITGTLDLLGHEPPADRLAERLGRVAAQAQRAVSIVRTLLALARKRRAQRTTIDLNDLLVDTLELTAYDLERARIRVVRELSDGLPSVSGAPGQLQQVFTNLVLNACQAVREAHGSGSLTVTTDLDLATGHVRVTVADDGPGIVPEHLARLFEPFFTTKPEGQGTGLGLAICRRIVESHGGEITAVSEPGLGARFTVALPATETADQEERMADSEPAPRSASVRVLVVEDEPLVAEMVEELLVLDGYEVDRATNGREALDRVGRRTYALVISDVRMPDGGGPVFYQELRRLDPALARCVVFVTGDVVSVDTRHFLEETGLPWVAKPFAVADLQAAVRRALAAR